MTGLAISAVLLCLCVRMTIFLVRDVFRQTKEMPLFAAPGHRVATTSGEQRIEKGALESPRWSALDDLQLIRLLQQPRDAGEQGG